MTGVRREVTVSKERVILLALLLAVGFMGLTAGLALQHASLAVAGALLTAGAAGDGAVLWASRGLSGATLVADHPTEVGLRLCSRGEIGETVGTGG